MRQNNTFIRLVHTMFCILYTDVTAWEWSIMWANESEESNNNKNHGKWNTKTQIRSKIRIRQHKKMWRMNAGLWKQATHEIIKKKHQLSLSPNTHDFKHLIYLYSRRWFRFVIYFSLSCFRLRSCCDSSLLPDSISNICKTMILQLQNNTIQKMKGRKKKQRQQTKKNTHRSLHIFLNKMADSSIHIHMLSSNNVEISN